MNYYKKIVVTGGAGFIGGHLVERLAALGMGEVLVLDNLHRSCTNLEGRYRDGIKFAAVDIRNREDVTRAMRGAEVVFHLAAQSNVMGAVGDPGYAFDTNVTGTFNVLQAARKAGVKRLVFTSSREVYGEPEYLPAPESLPLRPKNGYGASKAAGELYCALAAAEGLQTVILRLANVYGPRDRDRVIPRFLSAAEAGVPLEIYGGDQVLDFIWVGTVVDAFLKAAFGEWLPEPVNLGSGRGTTLLDLAKRVGDVTGSHAPIQIRPKRHEEVRRFVADITRAVKLLGISAASDPLAHLPALVERERVLQAAAS